MKWIIALFLNIAIIWAQADQACVLPTTSTITIGLTNHICAKIIYQNSTYVYSFPIKVDKISVLSLKDLSSVLTNRANRTNENNGTNQTNQTNHTNQTNGTNQTNQTNQTYQTDQANQTTNISSNISLHLQFQNSKEGLSLLLSNEQGSVFRNLISVVIKVNNGIFSGMINDSQDCSACDAGPNICYQDSCFNNGKFLEQSNLYIYVSWIGTDLNRHHMISYTQRLKKLSKFSFGNIYSQAFSIY